ncbi:hypothetical protein ACHAWF_015665 [Thalassiosira exigua]
MGANMIRRRSPSFSTLAQLAIAIVFSISPEGSDAFSALASRGPATASPHSTSRTAALPSHANEPKKDGTATSRRDALRRASSATIAGLGVAGALLPASPALADVTNKVAGAAALRSLSNLRAQLPRKLLPPCRSSDYLGARQALREPPLDGMRKSMLVLVRGAEDGPKAKELQEAYQRLVGSLEKIDATSSLGMRGDKTVAGDPFRLGLEYDDVENALGNFIELAAEAASIPLQEGTGQEMVGSIDVRTGKVTPRVL